MWLDSLKNIIPMTLLFKIKYFNRLIKKDVYRRNSKKKIIYYLDAPDYGNLGDQAIAYAINLFSSRYFPDYQMVELSPGEYARHRRAIKKSITEDDIIFLTGGGNMGNKYRLFEGVRRIVIQDFPKNTIVVFPQTIDYSDNIWGRLSKKHSAKIYKRNSKLILCAREDFSFISMKSLYPFCKVILCPDIVLSLTLPNDEKRRGIGVCFRDDIESALSNDQKKQIVDSVVGKKTCISTMSMIDSINSNNRYEILCDKWKEFGSKELIITDRLHAMIFSYLLRVPCYVYRNGNKKIEGVYKWIEKCPYVHLMNADEEIPVVSTINIDENSTVALAHHFDNLALEIKKGEE